ncbi:FAD-binding oxidoreductase [Vulgatibacter sp.]|uniref:FAD-binding oxidoreductase n=1 Tax=Vulgatibacter sp. TaxID=1971226 RepID=UPI0035637730
MAGVPEVPLVSRKAAPPGDAALAAALAERLGRDRIATTPEARDEASRDLWPRSLLWLRADDTPPPPDLICRPRSVEEVAELIRFARERGVAVVPHGARSGVCGGTLHLHGGVALDLRGLDRVRSVDPERLEIEVEAGAMGWPLEQRLAAQGLTLGHFPSSIALSTVGGWVAARGAGQSSSRYGKIEDLLLGLEVVLGTGEVVRLDRPAAGSDLLELFLGSEGILGAITAARLRLFPAPEVQLPRGYRFASLHRALQAMEEIFHAGLRPSVARLYDPFDTWIALGAHAAADGDAGPQLQPPVRADLRTSPERGSLGRKGATLAGSAKKQALQGALSLARPLNLAAGTLRSCLLVLVHEGPAGETRAEAARTRAICAGHGGTDLGEGPGRRWLRKRWAVSYQLPKMFDAGTWVDTCEVATSWGRVEPLYRAIRHAVAPHAFVMAHFSHAWPDGCSIYFTFSGPAPSVERGLRSYDAAWRAALDAAAAEGATITHHHGVGVLKGPWLEAELGAGGLALLQATKRVCDPDGILNPGKLVP